jgi:phosphate transport system permease protein
MPDSATTPAPVRFAVTKRRLRFLGLTLDDTIRAFFGGNALVAVVVLALITVFLVREGFGFSRTSGCAGSRG